MKKNTKALAHVERARVLLNEGLGFGDLTPEDMRHIFDTVIQNEEAMYKLNSQDFDYLMGTNKEIRNSCKDFLRKAANNPKFFIERFDDDRRLTLLLVEYGDFVEMIKPFLNILLQHMKDINANPKTFLHKTFLHTFEDTTDFKFALRMVANPSKYVNPANPFKYVNIEDRCKQIALIWLLMKRCQSNGIIPSIKHMAFSLNYLWKGKHHQSTPRVRYRNDSWFILQALDFICSNKTASDQDWDLIACYLQDMYGNDHEKRCDLYDSLGKIEIPHILHIQTPYT